MGVLEEAGEQVEEGGQVVGAAPTLTVAADSIMVRLEGPREVVELETMQELALLWG